MPFDSTKTTLLAVVLLAGAGLSRQVPSAAPSPAGGLVRGSVRSASNGAPVPSARATLFDASLGTFREARSGPNGDYSLRAVPPGIYRLGVAAPGFEYEEQSVLMTGGSLLRDFLLVPESHPGAWETIGNTLPELFDATDIAALRPDGSVLFCHDTVDPILFDPVTGQKTLGPSSGSEQGCMNTSLLSDGSVLFAGGQDGSAPGNFTNAIPWVKRFRLGTDDWVQMPDMLLDVGRWYPGLARLADGRLLIMGGGTAPSAVRTDTCETFDPATGLWTMTGTMGSAVEFPPAALLYTGEVLRTWGSRPQLFDPVAGSWSDTGEFAQSARGYPGHSDHSLIVLQDGRALAVGIWANVQASAEMTEFYEPATGVWSAGTSPDLKRMQCEIVPLPDGQVLVQGGETANTSGSEPNILGIVRRCDLFAPQSESWRRIADTPEFREYHAVTLLLPDGRVMTTGGTWIKFTYGPTSADIDAYSPPYLFRGVRPEISGLSDASPQRGQTLSFDVFPNTRLTGAVLMGVQSTTHWVDGGIPRRLELPLSQVGTSAQLTLPSDADRLPVGWYMLFAMVDDIPSEAVFLNITP